MVVDTTYYDVLEVDPTCTSAELKKSYRRLCLLHHPDKLLPGADHAKFQQIQQAYQVLSNDDQRDHYDQFGLQSNAGRGGEDMDMDMDDIFQQMFGGGMGGGPPRPPPRPSTRRREGKSAPSSVEMFVTLEELYMGKEKSIAVERTRTCTGCKGTGAKPRSQRRTCIKCHGAGQVYALRQLGAGYMTRVPVQCPACTGEGYSVRAQDACKKCQGKRSYKEKKKVAVRVERGAVAGEEIILRGEGDESPDHSAPGDLHITLVALPHPTFTLLPPSSSSRSPSQSPNLDLCTTLSLTLSESLLGFSRLILVHLDGRHLRVTQPAPGQKGWRVLQPGMEVRVKGEGMHRRSGSGSGSGSTGEGEMRKGDLRFKVEVEWPGEEWAMGLQEKEKEMRGEGGAETKLEQLLPPKREDLTPPAAHAPPAPGGGGKIAAEEVVVEEVELVDPAEEEEEQYSHTRHHHRRAGGATASDDEDEYYENPDEDGRPSCHQQ